MAENKKSIIVYADWIELFDALQDDEAGRLIKHFFRYVNDLDPKAPDRITELSFIQIKQSLKRDLKKYENYIEKQKANGLKGGRPKANETQITQPFISEPKKADSVSVSVSVSDNDSVNVIKKSILERKAEFKNSLPPHFLNENDLNDFYFYWTEHGINDKKMRWEKEKSFGIERRVATWMKNKEKFNKNKNEKLTGAQAFLNQFE